MLVFGHCPKYMGLFKEFFAPSPRFQINHINFNGLPTEVFNANEFDMRVIASTSRNLQLARRAGIKPLTLADVLDKIPPDQISSLVLFDTPPLAGEFGNHWRVLDLDEDKKEATLQHCIEFGNYDNKRIRPIKAPLDWELFTGVTIMRYVQEGKELPLSLVVKLYEADQDPNIQSTETILWSDKDGKLSKRDFKTLSDPPVLGTA